MESLLSNEQFAPIEFFRRDLSAVASIYRVYTEHQQFTEVEASSAYEAMVRSEIHKPLKIQRYAARYMPVLPHDMLIEPAMIAATESDILVAAEAPLQ